MSGDTPDTAEGAAFAAGHAAATADQARDDAAMAEAVASSAAGTAADAAETAARAESAAYATAAAVEDLGAQLRAEMGAALDEFRELIRPPAADANDGGGRTSAGGDATGAGAVPAPERKEEAKPPAVEGDGDAAPKRSSGYGSRRWFGN